MSANPAAAQEVWEVLKNFPYITRYRLYGLWRNLAYTKYPELIRARIMAIQEAKKIMRYETSERRREIQRREERREGRRQRGTEKPMREEEKREKKTEGRSYSGSRLIFIL